jgi:hypothetical protein
MAVTATSPYGYASNDPVNDIDPLGMWSFGSLVSHVVHAAGNVVHAAAHVVSAVTGAVTHVAHVAAGAVEHAFSAVHAALDNVVKLAKKAASAVAHTVVRVASDVVHTVQDAASRTVGMVTRTASRAWQWVRKHNEVFGKVGSVLSNISGGLAIAGLLIAPIPGLDALTPVLEAGAAATAIGALAAQGIAKAAGDRNVSYGDLVGDALGVIPGGRAAEEAAEGGRLLGMVGRVRGALGRLRGARGTEEEIVPVLRYPGKSLPQTADNMARYMRDKGLDEKSTFIRADAKTRAANYRANRKLYKGGPSMEEFPFASTKQGGPGAYLAQVPIVEQRAQGRLLANFYRVNDVKPGDPFGIWIDWGI